MTARTDRSAAAVRGPWLLALGLFLVYGTDSISRYYRAAPGSYDLGIFTEVVRDYAHFHAPIVDILAPGYNLLGDHFHPILAVLGPLFLLAPSPVTLLVAQALLFAVAAVPIVWLGRDRIGPGGGYAVGVAYGLSFGVAQAVDFDFHEIAFAVPLLAFALWALFEERTRTLVVCCFLLLLCKEDLGLTFVLPIGIAVILRGRIRLGGAIAAMGVAGSLTAIYWIIPHFNAQHVYQYWSKNSCVGTTAGVAHGNAVSCLWDSGMNQAGSKIELVFLLLAVTAFTVLRSPYVLLVLANLGLRFISTDTSFWGTAYHYNAVLMPVLAVVAIDAIERARHTAAPADAEESDEEPAENEAVVAPAAPWWRRWGRIASDAIGRHGAVAMLAASVAMVPQFAFNQFFSPSTFTFDARTAELRHAVSIVPENVTVEATINVLAPLAAKDDAFWIGNTGNPAVQYVVLDTVVSGFSGTISDPVAFVEQRHPGAKYSVIWSDTYGIYVLRRS
ncbi:MAG TPA: DUF2079 domain-containing protein [Actinospica sp.]|nr:DUF2079 domain-containing protein [Actinospica sp.]